MKRVVSFSFVLGAALGLISQLVAADEPVFSGPQVGERIVPFKVLGVYDEQEGKELDFVTQADGRPLLLIFFGKLSRPAAALGRTLASYAHSRAKEGLHASVVWLARDRSQAEQYLKFARRSLGFQVPVGISIDGAEGPGSYGLNRNVALTILLAKGNRVTANFALVQPSVADAPKITAEVVKLIGGKAPTLGELNALAFPGRKMEAKGRARRGPAMRGRLSRDPKLRELLRTLIRPRADADEVYKVVRAVEKYVGEDKAKQRELGQAARMILSRQYGTPPARKQLRIWAEKFVQRPNPSASEKTKDKRKSSGTDRNH